MPAYEYNFFANLKPADINEAELITTAFNEELIECIVVCCNLDSIEHTVRVGIGTGVSSDFYLAYDYPIDGNMFHHVLIRGLGNSKKVFVRTNSANNIDFSITGQKKTT